MAPLDDAPDDTLAPGPRRSTWTPPPGGFDESALLAGDPTREVAPTAPAPAPDDELPTPPPRRSLDDDEIVRALEAAQGPSTETIDLIDQIQQQMMLREREVAEYRAWEAEMVELGTPEAFAALERSRGTFTGVIPVITAESAYAVSVELPDTVPDVAARENQDAPGSAAQASADDTEAEPAPEQDSSADPAPVHSFGALLAGGVDLPHREEPAERPEDHPAPTLEELTIPTGPITDEGPGLDTVEDTTPPSIDESRSEPNDAPVGAAAESASAESASGAAAESASAHAAEGAGAAAPQQAVAHGAASEPVRRSIWAVEAAGLEPTPLTERTGRASRMLWLWFAVTSSVISVGVGGIVFSLGLSLRQAIMAVLVGVGLSLLPLALGTLAGKWSGQPAMVVSRASFGVLGNLIPALLAVVTRVFWAAVLLWLLATAVSSALAEPTGGQTSSQTTMVALAVAFVVATALAFIGFRLIALVQLVVSGASAALIIALIVLTAGHIHLGSALLRPDGSWLVAGGGVVIVFSVVGLAWATSASDLARYQRPGTAGSRSMAWAAVGAAVPPFVLIGWGALLSASDSELAGGLASDPIHALSTVVPPWFLLPLLASAVLSLLSAVTVALYSGGFAIQSTGLRLSRPFAVLIGAILVLALAVTLAASNPAFDLVIRDVATTLAVPVAAWVGIFAAEMMIRNRRFDTRSLLERGGVYPDVRWLNLGALIVITVIGFGFTAATLQPLSWQGYLIQALGIARDSSLALADYGVLIALALGLATPVIFGVAAVGRQESARA